MWDSVKSVLGGKLTALNTHFREIYLNSII